MVEFEQKSRFEPETMKPIIVCYVPDPLTHFRNVLRIQLLIRLDSTTLCIYLCQETVIETEKAVLE